MYKISYYIPENLKDINPVSKFVLQIGKHSNKRTYHFLCYTAKNFKGWLRLLDKLNNKNIKYKILEKGVKNDKRRNNLV